MEKQIDLDKYKIYSIFKKEILNYITKEKEKKQNKKINFDDIINIEEILDLILNDERKGIRILPYIDLSSTSFKNQNIVEIDFTNTNAKINPQSVKGRDFTSTKLNGLDFKGCIWDNTRLAFTSFEGAKNVKINPATVMYPSLYGCICKGVDFKDGSFKGVGLSHTDLRGALNVVICKKEIWNQDLTTTLLDENAIIIDSEYKKTKQQLQKSIRKRITQK